MTDTATVQSLTLQPDTNAFSRVLGEKQYELTNHLGNVLATVTDQKIPVEDGSSGTVAYWNPKVVFYSDYMPFGMQMVGRNGSSQEYRFGFNSQEKDDEIYGTGNSMTAEFWQYDARLGRRWNVDPVVKQWASPYESFSSNPINRIDPKGDTDYKVDKKGRTTKIKGTEDNENDRFIAVGSSGTIEKDKNGNITNPVITLEKGVVDNVKTDYQFNESNESSILSDETHNLGLLIKINNKKDGVSLFEFYAEQTEVEVGLLHYNLFGKDNIILTTSHHQKTERVSASIMEIHLSTDPSSFSFYEHRHSHPKGRNSWDYHRLSGPDKSTRDKLIEFLSGYADVTFLLWDEGVTKDVTDQK